MSSYTSVDSANRFLPYEEYIYCRSEINATTEQIIDNVQAWFNEYNQNPQPFEPPTCKNEFTDNFECDNFKSNSSSQESSLN